MKSEEGVYRKKALQDLLAKVEAGVDLIQPWFFQDAFNNHNHKNCAEEAFTSYHDGSLDAAKVLHEAVAPEQSIRIERRVGGWVVWLDNPIQGISDSPARAWLIAIIKALIAQEGET